MIGHVDSSTASRSQPFHQGFENGPSLESWDMLQHDKGIDEIECTAGNQGFQAGVEIRVSDLSFFAVFFCLLEHGRGHIYPGYLAAAGSQGNYESAAAAAEVQGMPGFEFRMDMGRDMTENHADVFLARVEEFPDRIGIEIFLGVGGVTDDSEIGLVFP